MQAFILAGGFATRLWPLTERRAKPLLPLAGEPIITHLLKKIPSEMPVTVSTNAAFADGFKTWMDSLDRPKTELVIEGTTKDDHKLGALGSIAAWIAAEKIDDDLLILTGDNYLGFDLKKFLTAFHGNPLLAAHDVGDLERAKQFGTVIIEDGGPLPLPSQGERVPRRAAGEGAPAFVKSFEEKPLHPKSTLVSTGCVLLPRSTLPILIDYATRKPDNLGGIFEEFLTQNIPVEYFTFAEPWMDIGSFHSYLDAHRELVGEEALIDPSATVENSDLHGSVTVGKNCVIEGSELTDCMIFDSVTIRNCTLRNCVIDDGCILEGIDLQNQMIRAGTRLVVQ